MKRGLLAWPVLVLLAGYQIAEPVKTATVDSYFIKPGMVITILVKEDRTLCRQYLVPNDGAIDYPPLGKVVVAGLKSPELANAIKEALEKDYLRQATVTVSSESATPRSNSVHMIDDFGRTNVMLLPGDYPLWLKGVVPNLDEGMTYTIIRYDSNGTKYITRIRPSHLDEFDGWTDPPCRLNR